MIFDKELIGKCGDWELYRTSSGRYSLAYQGENIKAGMTSDTAYYYWINILKRDKKGMSFAELPVVKQKVGRVAKKLLKKGEKEQVAPYYLRAPGGAKLDFVTGQVTVSTKSDPYKMGGVTWVSPEGKFVPTRKKKGRRKKNVNIQYY